MALGEPVRTTNERIVHESERWLEPITYDDGFRKSRSLASERRQGQRLLLEHINTY